MRDKRNFTFFDIKRKKIHIVIMLRYEKGEQLIKKQNLIQLTQSVQDFYNGSCFQVTLENETNLDEVIKAIEAAYKQQNKK